MAIQIKIVVSCDRCPQTRAQAMDVLSGSGETSVTLMKRLRAEGWRFMRDQSWKLALTLCPICATRKKSEIVKERKTL